MGKKVRLNRPKPYSRRWYFSSFITVLAIWGLLNCATQALICPKKTLTELAMGFAKTFIMQYDWCEPEEIKDCDCFDTEHD